MGSTIELSRHQPRAQQRPLRQRNKAQARFGAPCCRPTQDTSGSQARACRTRRTVVERPRTNTRDTHTRSGWRLGGKSSISVISGPQSGSVPTGRVPLPAAAQDARQQGLRRRPLDGDHRTALAGPGVPPDWPRAGPRQVGGRPGPAPRPAGRIAQPHRRRPRRAQRRRRTRRPSKRAGLTTGCWWVSPRCSSRSPGPDPTTSCATAPPTTSSLAGYLSPGHPTAMPVKRLADDPMREALSGVRPGCHRRPLAWHA